MNSMVEESEARLPSRRLVLTEVTTNYQSERSNDDHDNCVKQYTVDVGLWNCCSIVSGLGRMQQFSKVYTEGGDKSLSHQVRNNNSSAPSSRPLFHDKSSSVSRLVNTKSSSKTRCSSVCKMR